MLIKTDKIFAGKFQVLVFDLQDAGEQSLVSAVLDHFAQNVLAHMTELPHGELVIQILCQKL